MSDIGGFSSTLGVIGGVFGIAAGIWGASVRRIFDKQLHDLNLELLDKIHQEETRLDKRQLIIPLWEKFISCNEIRAIDPNEEDVKYAVNLLQLIAVCWEASIVDKDVVSRIFGGNYVKLRKQINGITSEMPGLGVTGPDLLTENKPIEKVFAEISSKLDSNGAVN